MKRKYAIAVTSLLIIAAFGALFALSPGAMYQFLGEPAAATDISEQGLIEQTEPVAPEIEEIQPGEKPAETEPDYSSGLDGFSLEQIPQYSGTPYAVMNGNQTYFEASELPNEAFEYYTPLDDLGRCGITCACVGKELMPTEERGQIGMIKPSGWHTVRYDDLIEDHYLYNRCHLLGYQLTGENANMRNLITGTRAFNTEGMEPFEDKVAGYVRRTGNHVHMRVTPVFSGNDLVARGVLMEAQSLEDKGDGLCFCVFVYNVQPGIVIDYATGDSQRAEKDSGEEQPVIEGYIGNKKSMVFHLPTCPNLPAEKNWVVFESRDAAVAAGFHACGNCCP